MSASEPRIECWVSSNLVWVAPGAHIQRAGTTTARGPLILTPARALAKFDHTLLHARAKQGILTAGDIKVAHAFKLAPQHRSEERRCAGREELRGFGKTISRLAS